MTLFSAREQRWLAPALAGLFATVVSLIAIGTPSLWGDEVVTVMSATRSWSDLWVMLGHFDAVHGAYYIMMHVWIDFFGVSPISVRVPSAIGVGIAAAGVVTFVRLFRPTAPAVVAGLVFALLPRVQEMGGEARSYGITMAFAAWLLVVGQSAASSNTARGWLGYAALLALGTVWFVYLPLLALSQIVVLAWLYPLSRRSAAVAVIGAGIIVAPFLWVAFRQREQIAWIAAAGLNGPLEVLVSAWFGERRVAVIGWALIILAVILAIRRKKQDPLLMTAAVTALGPLAVLWASSFVVPVFAPRYLITSVPSVAILIALALVQLWSWRRVVGAATALLMLLVTLPVLVAQRDPHAKHDFDWAELAAIVQTSAQPGDGIIFDESGRLWARPRLAMHGYPSSFSQVDDVLGLGLTAEDVWDTHVLSIDQADWLGKLGMYDRIWLVEHAGQPIEHERATLEGAGFKAGETQIIHSTQLTLFSR
ncbi:MAG: glycosyltransferase family 39 protein [Microbacteriaceae bacterium]